MKTDSQSRASCYHKCDLHAKLLWQGRQIFYKIVEANFKLFFLNQQLLYAINVSDKNGKNTAKWENSMLWTSCDLMGSRRNTVCAFAPYLKSMEFSFLRDPSGLSELHFLTFASSFLLSHSFCFYFLYRQTLGTFILQISIFIHKAPLTQPRACPMSCM